MALRDALERLIEDWRRRQAVCEQAVFCVREERSRADTYEFCAEALENAVFLAMNAARAEHQKARAVIEAARVLANKDTVCNWRDLRSAVRTLDALENAVEALEEVEDE